MLKQWITRVAVGRISVGATLEPGDRPDAAFESSWRSHMKARLIVALGLMLLWAAALEARLVYLQVVAHEEFVARAREQHQNMFEPAASRGDILDRNGEMLAYAVESHRVIAYPNLSDDPVKDAGDICAALGDCTVAEQNRLAADLKSDKKYLVVRNPRLVSPAASIQLQALIDRRKADKLPAVVSLNPESRRFYPKRDLASHVLGFVSDQGHGAAGVEAKYESVIAGRKGLVYVQVDGRGGREISTRVERAPTAGANLELTIDLRLQNIVERELAAGVRAADAAGGVAIILDPHTGEILAQASYPTFNPNIYWEEPEDARRNRVVTDTYEPGSTFKLVTASAALEAGFFKTTDLIDTSPGIIHIPGRGKPIDEADGHNYGVLSFEDVLIKSSNVGAIMIGRRIGGERLMQNVRRFGFGQILSPDFAGQSRGQVPSSGQIDDSTLASISMGYQLGVTPLQVAVAASVVANGGLLVEPRILRAITRDGRREVLEPKVIRRVISAETALTMTALMEGVVERGTARGAALTRFRVAGKTGTAAKVVDGRYSETDFNVSFVGFAPSRQPALTILVVIDTPKKGRAYGGTIAAPIFRRIADAALQQIGATPSVNPAAPIVAGANQILPAAPRASLPTITQVGGQPVMPDIRGLTLRDALRVANALGITLRADGDGVVVTQAPAPGEVVGAGDTGLVRLHRHPAADGGRR